MKRLPMLALVLVAALAVGVSTASASKIQLYSQCQWTSTSLHTSGGTAGNQTVTNPVRIGFGWAARKSQQVQQFLNSQYANAVVITDAFGNEVYPYATSWTQGLGSYWGPITAMTIQNNSGSFIPGYASAWRSPDFTLTPGQYYLTLDLDLATGVNDGENAASPGSWLSISNCAFTVSS